MTAVAYISVAVAFFVGTSFAGELRSGEQVIFFPSAGWRVDEKGTWEVSVQGWVFELEERGALLPAFQRALGLDDNDLSDVERQIFRNRARYFLADNKRGKRIVVQIAGRDATLPESEANGHFQARGVRVEGQVDPKVVLFTSGGAIGMVCLLETTGLSVISDVDDTIKISEVRDRNALLRNTFTRNYRPVPGMAGLYSAWAKAGANFHYVSASPWQLYPALSEFARAEGFPNGTWQLKTFRWKDRSFFDLIKPATKYKPDVIESIMDCFPNRRFVLVGDSGELDPEIYGDLARWRRSNVAHIFIRDVTGESPDSPRYQGAFREVPRERWTIFKEPTEISTALP